MAGAPVSSAAFAFTRPELDEGRIRSRTDLRVAELRAELAARMEPAAGRRVHGRGDVPLEDDAPARQLRVRNGDRGEESLRIWMLGIPEQVPPVGDLDDPAEVHDGHPVADVLD